VIPRVGSLHVYGVTGMHFMQVRVVSRHVHLWQAPAGAGGHAAGPLDFLRSNPQFIALRQIVQSNPMILQPMLQVIFTTLI